MIFGWSLSPDEINSLYVASLMAPLSMVRSGGDIILSWPAGTLQQAGLVPGPYTNLTSVTSPYTNHPSATMQFSRVLVREPLRRRLSGNMQDQSAAGRAIARVSSPLATALRGSTAIRWPGKPLGPFRQSVFGPTIHKNQRIVHANQRFGYSIGAAKPVGSL